MGFDKTKAVRAAEKYLAQNKIPAAIQEYRRIVENDMGDISSLNTLGDLYARTDKREEAVTCFKRVAGHYREQGFGLKAIAVYKKISRFKPEDTDVAAALGALYEQQGLLVEARAQYLMVADSLGRKGQSREALDILRRVADLDPNNVELRLRLAQSFLREEMHDMAAVAYIEAGERLSSQGHHERARDAYVNALTWMPASHIALQGLIAAHTALGTADEAADLLEQAVAAHPGDSELRQMLAQAHIQAENASAAELAVQELVEREASNYPLFFEVASLYLEKGSVDEAVRVLSRVTEAAMAGRDEEKLLELLQEALSRDPEQLDALRLLVRIHAWQRDTDRLQVVLESLAEIAETLGLEEDERSALSQLVRLVPDEERFRQRLDALGGSLEEEPAEEEMDFDSGQIPTFESFMFADAPFGSEDTEQPTPAQTETEPRPASEFEWNTVEPPAAATTQDMSASFADLNDFTDSGGGFLEAVQEEPDWAAGASFQEVDFSFSKGSASDFDASEPPPLDERRLAVLEQELEGVDFYLAQGYSDIALDSLDVLERQFGAHPSIEARRQLAASSTAITPVETPSNAFGSFADMGQSDGSGEAVDFADVALSATNETPVQPASSSPYFTTSDEATAAPLREQTANDAHASNTPAAAFGGGATAARASEVSPGGLDPGLAAIFDEFREAVEEADPSEDADYETHYNMGVAYKEMDLLDQAIEEFQIAAGMTSPGDGTSRYLQCCNLLGHCFMSKGVPRAATIWFQKGLQAPGHTEDEYQALRFELATAFEQMGDLERAIDTFTEVYGIDVSYRGVADRLRELQAQRAAK